MDNAYLIFTTTRCFVQKRVKRPRNKFDITMKNLLTFTFLLLYVFTYAQEKVNPVIKSYGGIYEIPDATVKPDPDQEYKIVIDVYGGAEDKAAIDRSLNNVARMLNLHAVGGVPAENLKVVLALHGKSTFSTLNDVAFQEKFGRSNPNINLMKELKEAGVKITVCGQSLKGRGLEPNELAEEVELATSMLTTVTYYQHQGYVLLKF